MTGKRSLMLNLTISIMLAAILMFTLAISALPALAANTDPAYPATEAAITKILKTPYGTKLPAMNFKFVVTQTAEDEKAPTAAMPDIGTVTISFDGKQTLDPGIDGSKTGTDVWYLESKDIFAGKKWPHAGVYEYNIKETALTNTASAKNPTEVYAYSKAEYKVLVYVANINGQLKITHIGVLMIKNDAGATIEGTDQVKVNPTPGGDGGDKYIYSQMIFTNSYVKTNDGTDPEKPDDWTLAISKKVVGDFSDPSIYFNFKLSVYAPELLNNPPAYNAYIVEYNPAGGKYSVVGTPIAFNSGVQKSFQLRHNQFLVFLETPVGMKYAVSEEGTAGYIPKAVVTYAGAAGAEEVGKKGEGLELPAAGNLVYKDTLYIGDGVNSAAFVNDRGTTTPTGISMDDLPFIVLIGVGMMALAGFAVFKLRGKAKENA